METPRERRTDNGARQGEQAKAAPDRYIRSREKLLTMKETDPVLKAVDKVISEVAVACRWDLPIATRGPLERAETAQTYP